MLLQIPNTLCLWLMWRKPWASLMQCNCLLNWEHVLSFGQGRGPSWVIFSISLAAQGALSYFSGCDFSPSPYRSQTTTPSSLFLSGGNVWDMGLFILTVSFPPVPAVHTGECTFSKRSGRVCTPPRIWLSVDVSVQKSWQACYILAFGGSCTV